jgi:hypothetical protein
LWQNHFYPITWLVGFCAQRDFSIQVCEKRLFVEANGKDDFIQWVQLQNCFTNILWGLKHKAFKWWDQYLEKKSLMVTTD